MKKIIAWCLSISLFMVPAFVFAAGGDAQGPSDRAYEKADEKAKFKRGDEGKARQAKDEDNSARQVKPVASGRQGDSTTVDEEEEGRPDDHQKKKGKGQKQKRN
ncbi:MAG: hypothetical protein PVG19_10800 [Desulfobacterales bacterium]|jgi:hypothetical protein